MTLQGLHTDTRGSGEEVCFQDSISENGSCFRCRDREKNHLKSRNLTRGDYASSFSADVASQMFVCKDMHVQKGGDIVSGQI